jgi:hypothetical protein
MTAARPQIRTEQHGQAPALTTAVPVPLLPLPQPADRRQLRPHPMHHLAREHRRARPRRGRKRARTTVRGDLAWPGW